MSFFPESFESPATSGEHKDVALPVPLKPAEESLSPLLLARQNEQPVCRLFRSLAWSNRASWHCYKVLFKSGQEYFLVVVLREPHNKHENTELGSPYAPELPNLDLPLLNRYLIETKIGPINYMGVEQKREDTLYQYVGYTFLQLKDVIAKGEATTIAGQLIFTLAGLEARGNDIVPPQSMLWNRDEGRLMLLQNGLPVCMKNPPENINKTNKLDKAKVKKELEAKIAVLNYGLMVYQLVCWAAGRRNEVVELKMAQRGYSELRKRIKGALRALKRKRWYKLIKSCVQPQATKRPTFAEVLAIFKATCQKKQVEVRRQEHTSITEKLRKMPIDPGEVIEYCYRHLNQLSDDNTVTLTELIYEAACAYHILGCAFSLSKSQQAGLIWEYAAEELFAALLGNDHGYMARLWAYFAAGYSQLDQSLQVLRYSSKAAERSRQLYGPKYKQAIDFYQSLALAYSKLEMTDDAIRLAGQADEVRDQYGHRVMKTIRCPEIYMQPQFAEGKIERYIHIAKYKAEAELAVEHADGNELSLIEAYTSYALDYSQAGQYKSAIDHYSLAAPLIATVHGDDSLELARNYDSTAFVYFNMYEYERALELLNKAERIVLLHPEDQSFLCLVYSHKATAYESLGNKQQSKAYKQKAEQYGDGRTEQEIKDHTTSSHLVHNAWNLIAKKNSNAALPQLQKAIYLLTRGKRECISCLALAYSSSSNVHGILRNMTEAIKYAFMAAELFELLPENTEDHQCSLWLHLAIYAFNAGRHQEAFEYMQKALEKGEKYYGPGSYMLVDVYRNLSLWYNYVGDTKTAAIYQTKQEEAEADLRPEQPLHALTHHFRTTQVAVQQPTTPVPVPIPAEGTAKGVGNANNTAPSDVEAIQAGDPENIVSLKKEIEQCRMEDGDMSISGADAIYDLGMEYYEVQQYQKALECYHKSSTIYESCGETLNAATAFSFMGQMYLYLNQADNAILYCSKAIAILGPNSKVRRITLANSYMYLGSAYRMKGDIDNAIANMDRAAKLYLAISDNCFPSSVSCFFSLHEMYTTSDRYSEAIQCMKEVQAAYASKQKEDQSLIYSYVYNAANYLACAEFQLAIETCQQAEALANRLYPRNNPFNDDITQCIPSAYLILYTYFKFV